MITPKFELYGRRLAEKAADVIKRKAVNAFLRREEIHIEFSDKYIELLAKSMVIASLQARNDVFKLAKKNGVEIEVLALSNPLDKLFAIVSKFSNPRELAVLAKKYKTRAFNLLTGVADKVQADLQQTVGTLITSGATTLTAKRVLGKRFDMLGLTPRNNYQVENIFRTQTQLAYGAAKYEAEQDPAVQEILWGYTYSTVGDNRVREEHAQWDGVTLPKDDPFWKTHYPPNGYSCRCAVIAVFEPREIVRPSLDAGDVDPDFKFNPSIILRG